MMQENDNMIEKQISPYKSSTHLSSVQENSRQKLKKKTSWTSIKPAVMKTGVAGKVYFSRAQ